MGLPEGKVKRRKPMVIETTKILEKPTYRKFSHFGRTLHIDNCEEAFKAKKLLVYGLNKKDHTQLRKDEVNIVWFKIDQDPEEQDWYGNVCFTIDFNELLKHFGGVENLYYVEEIEFAEKSYSRLLLTKKDSKLPSRVARINLTQLGSPIMRAKDGSFEYASKCKRTDGRMSDYHGIELMVDATVPDQIWLYKYCAKKAVNHSECNSFGKTDGYQSGTCRKFNTIHLECPYCYTVEETEKMLEQKCVGLLGSGLASNLPDISKLSI